MKASLSKMNFAVPQALAKLHRSDCDAATSSEIYNFVASALEYNSLGTVRRVAATNNLQEKICWVMRQHNVPPNRVWNIDETALKMFGSSRSPSRFRMRKM